MHTQKRPSVELVPAEDQVHTHLFPHVICSPEGGSYDFDAAQQEDRTRILKTKQAKLKSHCVLIFANRLERSGNLLVNIFPLFKLLARQNWKFPQRCTLYDLDKRETVGVSEPAPACVCKDPLQYKENT